jgi:hypothetical protein
MNLPKAILLLVLGFLLAAAINHNKNQQLKRPEHIHADIAVFVNGKKVDLNSDLYSSGEDTVHGKYIHMHDNNGAVIHIEQTGVTLRDFFLGVDGDMSWGCLKLESKEYCSSPWSGLKVYINGKRSWYGSAYQPHDLDRILITFGPWITDTAGEQAAITDQACIYSLKCPERGTPPEEDCLSDQPCVIPGM